jgi:uncharacterized protein
MPSELNPFVFTRPVDPEQLIDREEESRRLLDLAEGGHVVRLSAPRRYGKTSLLRRLGRDADSIGMNYVEVDFYGVLSVDDVIVRMEDAYGRLRTPLKRIAIATMSTLRPRLRVGAGPLGVEARLGASDHAGKVLTGLLDLPLTLFERTGARTLVAFDEFQALLGVGRGIDGLFRSRIQRQGDAASYVFAGSHPGLMAQLFGERERPFFGQARTLRLDPLPDSAMAEYIGARFEENGRDASPALEALMGQARGHPQRAMLLAHYLWEQTPAKGQAAPECWQSALQAVFDEHGEALQATWDALGNRERAVLAALAVGDDTLFNKNTLNRFGMSKGGAQHARNKLAHVGHIQTLGGQWQVVDPLLAEWIARLERPAERGRGLL